MIALFHNMIRGKVRIELYQDAERAEAEGECQRLEILGKVYSKRRAFVARAESLDALRKAHGWWFDKLEGR